MNSGATLQRGAGPLTACSLRGGRLRQSVDGLLVMHAENAAVNRGACDGGLRATASMTKEEKTLAT